MWIPSSAPWEFVIRAVIVYFSIMLLLRLSGKRTVGEFTAFDMIVILLISESTQGALIASDESITGALIVCATLVGLNFLTAFLSTRFVAVDKLVEGQPVVLIHKGKVFVEALRRNNVPMSDLKEALRQHGASAVGQVALAVLETDGTISVIKATSAGTCSSPPLG